MGQVMSFQDRLRRLALVDESFVHAAAGLQLDTNGTTTIDGKTACLLQLGASVAMGCPGVLVEWGASRALAAGASEDEISDVLLAIAPVTGLARVVGAVPDLAAALGYDLETALEGEDIEPPPVSPP